MHSRFLRFPRIVSTALAAIGLAFASAQAATITAAFNSASDVPVTSNGYTAAGNTVNLALNFKPVAGTELMVVKNTGLGFINGAFANLAHGQVVPLTFNGTAYPFVANYYGGSGNDLVLMWANNRAFAWGFSSSLGGSGARDIPVAVRTSGPLEGKTITAVAAGFGHSLALCSDGTLVAWGRNSEGQLGDGTTSFRFSPVLVNTSTALAGKTVMAISAGVFHSLALCSDGTVVAWGKNEHGQLGDGSNTNRPTPVAVNRSSGSALAGKTVVAIKAGAHHSLALCSDGIVVAWGLNANAQLGDNTTISRNRPMDVSRATGSALATRTVVALAAGNYHSMALCSDGAVVAWGNNNDGQLGQANPVTKTVEDIEIVVELFKGSTYTLFGQTLGAGTTVPGTKTTYTEISERRVPGVVRTSPDVSVLHNKTVVAIHAGLSHSMALCSDGTIAAWGDNTSGKIGDGTTNKRPTAVAVARSGTALDGKTPIAIGGGRHFSVALLSDGTPVAWGENEDYQLGDDTMTERHKAIKVSTDSLAPGERYVRISGTAETFHTVAIVASPVLPTMSVSGNNVVIAHGAEQARANDHTDFGFTALGQSLVRTFTIKNDGPAALNLADAPNKVVLSGANSAGFAVTQQPPVAQVASGSSTTFVITYTPTVVGQRSTATVTIANDDITKSPYTFTIAAAGPVPDIAVLGNNAEIANGSTKPSLANFTEFPTAALGTGVTRTFTIRNVGLGPLTLNGTPKVTLSGPNAADFAVTQQPASPVANGGGTTTFEVTYTPSVVGKRSAAVVSIASDAGAKSPYTFTIAGTGPLPEIALEGNSVAIASGSSKASVVDHTDFGTSPIGVGVTRTFTVKNNGLGPLTLSGTPKVAISGAGAAQFAMTQQPAATVAASGGTTTFQVTYTPIAVGQRSDATLTIASDDPARGSYTFAITGVGPVPSIRVLGNTLAIANGDTSPTAADHRDFGTGPAGVGIVRTFTISNAGFGPLSLTGSPRVTLSGANASDFAVTTQPSASVTPSGTTTFQITYTPMIIGKESKATVSIANNDASKPTYTFDIKGIGPVPEIVVSGNSALIPSGKTVATNADHTEFGTIALGSTIVRTFTIRNNGVGTLTLSGTPKVALSGAGAGDFAVTQEPAASVNPSGGTTTFQITYTPTVVGKRSVAIVTIASNDSRKPSYTFAIGATGPVPVMEVSANSIALANGQTAVDVANNTDFGTTEIGTPVVKTYTIKNTGLATLNLTGAPKVAVTGSSADYTVTEEPAASVAPGATTTFKITFNPVTNGLRTANIAIASDDTTANPYTFVVRGSGPTPTVVGGYAFTWGVNSDGSLGGTGNGRTPVAVDRSGVLADKTIVSIVNQSTSVLALSSDGKIFGWGSNSSGQLGIGSTTGSSTPVALNMSFVPSGESVVSLAMGGGVSFALTSSGKIFGWGFNRFGNLGINSGGVDVLVPTAMDMSWVPAGEIVTAVTVAGDARAALTSGGKVFCWGDGQMGRMGDGTLIGKNTPVRVLSTGVLAGKTITAIASGVHHILALSADGKVFGWGRGDSGQLGNGGSAVSNPEPVAVTMTGALAGKTVKAIAGGQFHSMALTTDGKVYTWGRGEYGRLGNGSDANQLEPVAVDMTGALAGQTVSAISGGDGFSVVVANGKAYTMGHSTYSGAGIFTNRNVPGLVDTCGALDGATVVGVAISSQGYVAGVLATLAPPVPPVAINDTYAATEDTTLTIAVGAGVMSNDTVRCGTTVTLVSTTTQGTLTLNADGSFTYKPAANFNGSDSFSYTATNVSGTSNVATVRLVTAAVNDAPVLALARSSITLLRNSGDYTDGREFATFSAGPDNEAAQILLGYTLANDNNALFTTQPAIDASGTLTFTVAPEATGTATVTVTAQDSGGTASGGVDQTVKTFTITVIAPNVAPTATFASANVTVAQNSGAYVANSFATFSPGPSSDSAQTLVSYTVTNDNAALFSVQPALNNVGRLTFTPAAGQSGSATVMVAVKDNGGTANGGVDTATVAFKITVTPAGTTVEPVNAAPTLALASGTIKVVQNSSAYTGAGFASFSPGPASESWQSFLGYTVTNDNPALFSAKPAINNAGTLTFTPATHARGTAVVTVVAQDSGGTDNGGVDKVTKTFSIVVATINSAPTVSFSTETVTAQKNAGPQTISGFATFSPGPTVDAGQTLLGYTVTNNNSALFSAQPAINNAGVLTFTPAADATGTATVTVVARDNGGTEGGGVDSVTRTFTIEIKDIGTQFLVTTTADSGPGSLREAILAANAAGGPVTILIVNGLGQLETTPPLPAITGNVKIDAGSGNTLGAPILLGSGGVLKLDGTTLPGSVIVQDGGTFANDGEISDELIVESGGILAPGASPGISKVGKATWKGGGIYEWEITDANGQAGTAWDLMTVKNTFTIAATADNQFKIKLKTLSSLTTAGEMANFDPTKDYAWVIARVLPLDATQPSSGDPRLIGFDGNALVIDRTGFANPIAGGRFALYTSGDALFLAFTPDNPPVVTDDHYVMNQGDTLVVNEAQGVLANDYDADLTAHSAVLLTNPANGGSVTLNANGSFTYTPSSAAFYGIDTFSYRANDGTLDSALASTVTVTVYARPVNTVPAAQFTLRNTTLRFSAATLPASNAVRVSDADSTTLTVDLSVAHGTLAVTTTNGLTLAKGASGASLSLAGATADVNAALESLAYTPAADYSGEDTLTVVTTDEGGRTNRGNETVAITVAPPPSITSATTASGSYKSAFTFSVTATGVGVTFSANGLPAGLAIDAATGAISGAPTESGSFNVVLTATDAGGNTDTRTLVLDIAKLNVTVSGVTAATRSYDATTAAALDFSGATLAGVLTGDDVKLVTTGATGAFASKAVGSGKTVTIAGLTLGGTHAAHYTLTQPTATAAITPVTLTVAKAAALGKAYDGTTAAALDFSAATLVGIIGSDAVTLVTKGATGTFADATVGVAKPVTIAGLSLDGADAGNYLLTQPSATATITPASVSIAFGNLSHVYDGSAKQASITATPNVALNVVYSPATVLDAGSYRVSASVNDSNFSGQYSATLTIAKATQTIKVSAPATATLGTPVNVNATSSSGLPVTLTVSGPASLSGTQLTFSAPGTATITATQSGDKNHEAVTATATITAAGKLAQTIAFAAPADRLSNNGSFTLNATATSGLPVSFAIISGPAMLSGNTVTLTGAAGQVIVRASQPGNDLYEAAPDVTASFTVTAATLNVFFGTVTNPTNNTKAGDVAATLPPDSNQGSLLVVALGVNVNTVLDFTLKPDGTFMQTVTIDAPVSGNNIPDTPGRAAAPLTLTIRGSLVNGRLQGIVEPLGLAFDATVLPVVGPSANSAGFYKSSTLANTSGATYSIVGTNNEVLVLAQTADVTTGGMTTLNSDGSFGLQTTTSAGTATIRGTVDEPTTTVSGTISLPGKPDTSFAGLVVTTSRTDRLINLSSRVRIGAGDRVLITGFVIGGNEPKQVLIRGIGPALAGFGVQGALANPRIRIYRDGEVVAENDDWAATAASGLISAFSRVGAFGLPAGSTDAALLTTLQPGAYTAQVFDGGGTGVALAEIYDASLNPNSEYQRLVNISTRGEAGSGENVLIGGFIVTGNSPKKLLVRGIGPGLAAFGVSGTLVDPRLRVFQETRLVAENDNWSASAAEAVAVADAARATGAFALTSGSRDAALILTLAPGAYTAQVGGADGTSSGIALVEIYEIQE